MLGLVILGLLVFGVVVHLVSRTRLWWAPGAVALAGAFALFADMSAAGSCHDGALCGMDAIGNFIEGAAGATLALAGVIALAVAVRSRRAHLRRQSELPRAIVR